MRKREGDEDNVGFSSLAAIDGESLDLVYGSGQ
jgi:hypothetical protein